MKVFGIKTLKDGYVRFSIEFDEGVIMDGFRSTPTFAVLMPPEGSWHGHPFKIIKVSAKAEEQILTQARRLHDFEKEKINA